MGNTLSNTADSSATAAAATANPLEREHCDESDVVDAPPAEASRWPSKDLLARAPQLKYPEGNQKLWLEAQRILKQKVAVAHFGHRCSAYKLSGGDPAKVLGLLKHVKKRDAYSGGEESPATQRCSAFKDAVNEIVGDFDFFEKWHATFHASIDAFLEAVVHTRADVKSQAEQAVRDKAGPLPASLTEGFESKASLTIDRIIEQAGGIDEVVKKLEMKPGESELERATRVAAAFNLESGTTEHLVFVISATLLSGDTAIKTELRCVNGIWCLHGCHMRASEIIFLVLKHPDLGFFPPKPANRKIAPRSPFGITEHLVQALAIIATLTSTPETIADHLCYYFRGAFRRAFGANLDRVLDANYGRKGANIVRARLADGTGAELRPDSDGHAAYDACCFHINRDRNGKEFADGEPCYEISQSRVHDTPRWLVGRLAYAEAKTIVLDTEFNASVEKTPPPGWPKGAWETMKEKGAFESGTGWRAAYDDFLGKVDASALMAPYAKYGFRISRILEVHGIEQTRGRVARCDALQQSVMHDNLPYDDSTPLGAWVMARREKEMESKRKERSGKSGADESGRAAKKAKK